MGANVEAWYEEDFIDGIREAFQIEGYLLRGKTLAPKKIVGSKATWKKMEASKARKYTPGNKVTPSNIGKSEVSADMQAYDDADYVYAVDVNRTSANERDAVQRAIGMSLGRQFDQLHFDEFAAAGAQQVGAFANAFSPAVAIEGVQKLKKATKGVPGNLYCAMPTNAFYQMATYEEISDSDWAGDDRILKKGTSMFMWSDVMWFLYGDDDAFPLAASDDRTFWMWHEAAAGHASAEDLAIDISWVPEMRGWLHQAWMDQAVKTIRSEGIIEFLCDDDAAFSTSN